MTSQLDSPVVDKNHHRGSEIAITQGVAPRYINKNNSTEDIEKGVDSGADGKLPEKSSLDSPQRIGSTETVEDDDYPPSVFTRYWRTYRPWGHAAIWLLVTAYSPLGA
jgi:hypothetical protein